MHFAGWLLKCFAPVWYMIYWSRNQSCNFAYFRHPTDLRLPKFYISGAAMVIMIASYDYLNYHVFFYIIPVDDTFSLTIYRNGSDWTEISNQLSVSNARMVISLVYYAVSFSAGTFGGNRYLVFFLTSLVEIPSNWTCIVLCRRYVCKHEKQFTQIIQFEQFLMESFQKISNY